MSAEKESGNTRANMKDTTQPQLIHYLETSLSQAIGSMTGRSISVALDRSATETPPLENATPNRRNSSPQECSFQSSLPPDVVLVASRE